MNHSWSRAWAWGVAALTAAIMAACTTDLRRDDIAGRPCPCLPGWSEQDAGSACICIQAGLGGASATSTNSGGANSGGATASTDSGGTTTGGTMAKGTCAAPKDPPPNPAVCPPQCSICSNGTCFINCNSPDDCSNTTVACPDQMPCQLNCAAEGSCNTLFLVCPAEYPCTIDCSGKKSCINLNVTCSTDGPCTLTCGSLAQVCSGATLTCGHEDCKAVCNGAFKPTVTGCDNSCQANCACP